MSSFRYFIKLSYKGTAYCGWQIQPNAITVQEMLNKALRTLLRQPDLETLGCGRTDTGVHASMFYAHFDSEKEIKNDDTFIYKVNALLPHDIAVQQLCPVENTAHTRFDAVKREYKYYIHFAKNPFLQDLSVYQHHIPDAELMNKAASKLLQVEDFTSFAKLHGDSATNICDVSHAEWTKTETGLCFTISANRFLRNMVRAVVGTLLLVGNKKISLEEFDLIINDHNRSSAGMSAPAHGLFLTRVEYPYIIV